MSDATGATSRKAMLSSGLDLTGPWHQRGPQTYLLTRSVHPPPTAGGGRWSRSPLRLPSLTTAAPGPCRRSSLARLSLSEPALLNPHEIHQYEGLSSNPRLSVLQKRPPAPPFSSQPQQQQNQQPVQSCSRPTFIHFSKPGPARRDAHRRPLATDVEEGGLRPTVIRCPNFQVEPLFVIGKPCFLSCTERPAGAGGPARTQLHVFLPTEAGGEEGDSESADEGFMDELDSKVTSLKLQQGATVT